jgi:hypothetical protein
MPEWTSNNLACLNVWSTLYIMKQYKKTFKIAGDIQMKGLLFYNPALTPSELEFEARGIADFLDIVFRKTCDAKYEQGVNRVRAMSDMIAVLIAPDKTVAHLAEIVDQDYEF